MLPRLTRNRVATLLLALFLAGQAMLAIAACQSNERSAARAVAYAAASSEPCHSGDQELSANLCVAHCVAGNQSLDKPTVKVPAFVVAAALVLPAKQLRLAVRAHELPLPVAGPPPRILFQTLQI